ncbi:NAD(P)/FAD-dependent oxidoreductase [Bradyrhizobium elkanii]|uniref:NAD(P)/FAD-dependent oxidoreductase n=1 Tax=Bradyrhizobium elkanii TaxID=29448 RepID=UPI001BABE10D|nr:NAD(P)/FAD-dependent oxidoreductase [Bradyrhizobium elkanii]MBR1158099.1 tryptophan 7-halogenase [Bradyrhizobium elkanii]
MTPRSTQILVVGGGPGGATSATLLARQGFKVTLMERETEGRYHIGESLLPSCLRILDLIGAREKVEKHGFQRKDGGYFDWGGQKWEVAFGNLARPLYGFQVIRSEFDRLLLDHARSEGVEVLDGTAVTDLVVENGVPVAANCIDRRGTSGRVEFSSLVDASGRAGLMATRYLNNRRFHKAFMNVALWGYWRGARRLAVGPFGAIATCSIPSGWIWAIPLHDGTLSVGVVLHKSKFRTLRQYFSLEEIYRDSIASNATVSNLVECGELQTQLRTETDYSYTAEWSAGPGYYMVGDAACFLDPLLSTGVHLATFSGLLAAACIASTLRGEVSAGDAIDFYNTSYRRAFMRMMVVVGAFYQTHRGRDSHFSQAQTLTADDYDKEELGRAFLHIISGVEDLKDAEDVHPHKLMGVLLQIYQEHYSFIQQKNNWVSMSADEINRGMTTSRFIGAVQEDFSLTPETAVNGLYVEAGEKLALRRTSGAASAA